MTQNEIIEELLVILQTLPAASGSAWTADNSATLARIYARTVLPWPVEILESVIQKVLDTCRWRPTVAELQEMACALYSPVVGAAQFWPEFRHKAITDGYRDPQWSHPLLAEIVDEMGGWTHWYARNFHLEDAYSQQQIEKAFHAAHTVCAARWSECVREQLRLPASERDPLYRVTGKTWVQPTVAEPQPQQPFALAPSIRAAIASVGKDLPDGRKNGKGKGMGNADKC